MADSLSLDAKVTLAPQQPKGQSNSNALVITAESHTQFFTRTIKLPAGSTDVAYVLPADFVSVAFLALQTDNPFSFKKGGTGNPANTVRKCHLETPNNVAPFTLYFTTTTLPVVIELMAVGD